jgi:integrase
MDRMPRRPLPHLHFERTRHDKPVWYVRIGKGPRVRLRALYGTPEFDAEYHAAIGGKPLTARRRTTAGTLEWAVGLYRDSAAWAELSPATRRQRENILARILAKAGTQPLSAITRAKIVEGRDRRKDTPAAARHFVATLRGFFQWAIERGLVATDPTQAVRISRKSGDGFPVWTEDEIARFEKRWPVGTRERVAFDVLLYTGLRRGDAAALGRQHVRDGVARIKTQKTGELVAIPIAPELEETIAAGPCGDLAYIATEAGAPMTKESFGNFFRDACRAAGISKSAHGLRKAAATRAANAGFSEAQLEARFGWRGGRMASLYTKSMDRERLSIDAQGKVKAGTRTPAPKGQGAGESEKDSTQSNG